MKASNTAIVNWDEQVYDIDTATVKTVCCGDMPGDSLAKPDCESRLPVVRYIVYLLEGLIGEY